MRNKRKEKAAPPSPPLPPPQPALLLSILLFFFFLLLHMQYVHTPPHRTVYSHTGGGCRTRGRDLINMPPSPPLPLPARATEDGVRGGGPRLHASSSSSPEGAPEASSSQATERGFFWNISLPPEHSPISSECMAPLRPTSPPPSLPRWDEERGEWTYGEEDQKEEVWVYPPLFVIAKLLCGTVPKKGGNEKKCIDFLNWTRLQ